MMFTISRPASGLTDDELVEAFDRTPRGDPESSESLRELRAEIMRRMGPCTRSHADQWHQQGLAGQLGGLGQAR